MPPTFNACAHVPGLWLEPGTVLQAGSWILHPLPHHEWLDLEDPAMVFVERRYASVAPVFLQGTIEAGPDPGPADSTLELDRTLLAAARRVSYALLFTHWRTFPDPGRSARYFRDADADGWCRVFGANERELLLISYPPYVTLAADELAAFTTIFNRLTQVNAGEETPEILRLIDTVRLAQRAGADQLDLVIYFVAAHEDIFNRAGDRPLGRTFARRLAAFFCRDFDRLGEWHQVFETMYDARSGALHGRDPCDEVKWLATRFTQLERFLLYACYMSCSQLAAFVHERGDVDRGLEELIPQLDRAADNRTDHEALQQRLNPGWLRS